MAAAITLTPSHAKVGTSVLITGSAFNPTDPLTITYDGTPIVPTEGAIVVAGDGTIPTCHIVIPDSVEGIHPVEVSDISLNVADADFTVDSFLSISPASGIVGDTPTITATGLATASAVTVDFDGTDVTPAGSPVTDATGGYSGTITIPTDTAGSKTVTITDASANAPTTSFDLQTAPDAPTLDSVTPISATELDLSWTAGADGGSAITGYKIERKIGSGSWTTLVANTGTTATTYDDTTLAHDETVSYRISAINAIGTSVASNVVSGDTWKVPVAPVLALDDLGATDLQFEFPAVDDNGQALTDYAWQLSLNVGFTSPVTTHITPGDDPVIVTKTGLTPGTAYWIRAKATNAAGDSLWSNVLAVTTDQGPSGAIVSLTTVPSYPNGLNSYKYGSRESIPVTDDAYVDFAFIDTRDVLTEKILLKNVDDTNGLKYTTYGLIKETASPPAYNSSDYVAINTEATLAAGASALVGSASYSWVLVRVKRSVSGSDATASVFARLY